MAKAPAPKTPGAPSSGPVDASQPSPSFSQEHAAVKEERGRGRPPGAKNKAKAAGASGSASSSNASVPQTTWTPELAAGFIQALHMLPAGLTGFGGFLYSEAELKAAAPISAEVFNDILPYDMYWFKLLTFAGVIGTIEMRKLAAYKKWKSEQDAAAALSQTQPEVPAKTPPPHPAGVVRPAPPAAPAGVSTFGRPIVLPGSEMPLAPGIKLPGS